MKCGHFFLPEAGFIFSEKGHCDKNKNTSWKENPFWGFICLKNNNNNKAFPSLDPHFSRASLSMGHLETRQFLTLIFRKELP